MNADQSSSITSGSSINGAQFAWREPNHLDPSEASDSSLSSSKKVVSTNITFDPNVVTLLEKGYNDSFVSIPLPEASTSQNRQAYINNLSAVTETTQKILKQEDKDNPISAQSILSEIQQALNAAQKIYNQYYAPGAPHADEIQGYRFPTQEVSNSMITVQHVAGLALVQTVATPNSEEQLLSSDSPLPTTLPKGLNIAQAKYVAGSSFLSLLRASHLHKRGGFSLESLRKLLAQLSVLRTNNSITRRDINIRKNLVDGPRAVLDQKTEERINQSNNFFLQLGTKTGLFLKRMTVHPPLVGIKKALEKLFPGTSSTGSSLPPSEVAATASSKASKISHQSLNYHITGEEETVNADHSNLSLDNTQNEEAANNKINLNPSIINAQLRSSIQQSYDRLVQLTEGAPQNQLNASLL